MCSHFSSPEQKFRKTYCCHPGVGIGTQVLIVIQINSLTTKQQTTIFSPAIFQRMLSPSYVILRIQRLKGNSVDLDEVACYEPPHQDLHCLLIELFSSLVIKELSDAQGAVR